MKYNNNIYDRKNYQLWFRFCVTLFIINFMYIFLNVDSAGIGPFITAAVIFIIYGLGSYLITSRAKCLSCSEKLKFGNSAAEDEFQKILDSNKLSVKWKEKIKFLQKKSQFTRSNYILSYTECAKCEERSIIEVVDASS